MKSIIKQLYTILLVTVACLTVAGCSDDFKSNLRLDGDVWVNSIKLDEYAGTIDYQNKTIVVGVPYDYDVTRMAVSEINLSEGATASIAVGETIDFSLPVSLTVKNGDVQMSYTITVKRDEAKKLISLFCFSIFWKAPDFTILLLAVCFNKLVMDSLALSV